MSVGSATSIETLRQCQAVLLPALLGATLEQTQGVVFIRARPTADMVRPGLVEPQAPDPTRLSTWTRAHPREL